MCDQGCAIAQCDLFSTSYIGRDPISKEAHLLRFQADMNLEGGYSSP